MSDRYITDFRRSDESTIDGGRPPTRSQVQVGARCSCERLCHARVAEYVLQNEPAARSATAGRTARHRLTKVAQTVLGVHLRKVTDMNKLIVLLATGALLSIDPKPAAATDLFAWNNHAAPLPFRFGNDFDGHQL